MATLLSRSALLSAKLPHRDVPVPEMGSDAVVRIQQMSVNTRANYLERIRQHRQAINAYEDDQALPLEERKNLAKPQDLDSGALAVVLSLVDEDGKPMFSEQDIPLLEEWAHNAVTRIYEAIIDLNDYEKSYIAAVETEKKD